MYEPTGKIEPATWTLPSKSPCTRDSISIARLGRVAEPTRQALETAAALGRRFEAQLLAAVLEGLGIPRWTMRDAVFRGLLRWEGAMLAFRHALAQAAIANAVPGDRLQVLHRAIFAELERNSIVGPRPREVRGSENYP